MCGLAGFMRLDNSDGVSNPRHLAQQMANAITYRGPDSSGVWLDENQRVALSHRRLAIVDLSPAGHQPMVSSCQRYVIAYNGEVYNGPELRKELENAGRTFRGYSDTEILLEGCAAWGVGNTLERLIGMFAFALWDRQEKRMVLARDRLGIKPLYWCHTGSDFLFGSELKALRPHPAFPKDINRNALSSYFRHNYIPAPFTMFEGVNKLEPGRVLTFSAGMVEPKIETYWSLADAYETGLHNPYCGSDTEAVDALENLLMDAVSRRMVADVPLGVFLSGGIDSSLVAGLMQARSDRPVKTFSIGFAEQGFNEAVHAAKVAKHLGTDHTELYVSPQDARDVIPNLPQYYDEPFADSSQIPTYLVSKMTREHVTVALSGDGGDELFAGYNRYFTAQKYGRMIFDLPGPLRNLGAEVIKSFSPSFWDTVFKAVPASKRPPMPGDKLHKLAEVLKLDKEGFYLRLISHWGEPDDLVIGGRETGGLVQDPAVRSRVSDFVSRMQYLDTLTYLPDDILTKVDRASMAVSLETRVPLLDHRVVEFAWTLPQSMKIRNGEGKWILREVLYRHVPKTLIDRPKMGFGIPVDAWLRGPLKDWAEELLSDEAINHYGLIHPEPVRVKWNEHLSGKRNWQYHLWDVLMLQSWCRHWL